MYGGIIHCFSYGKEMAEQYLNMGLYLGIGGVVTFKNAKKLKEVVEYAPLEQLVLETDSPYLSPEPNRGKRNSSLTLCSTGYWRTERDFRGGSDSHYRSECREASFSSHKIESYKIKSYKKLLWKLFQVNKICSSFYIRLSFLIFIAGVVISGTVIIAIIFCFLRGIPGTVIIAVRSSV